MGPQAGSYLWCDKCGRPANVMLPNLYLCDECFDVIDKGCSALMSLACLEDQWATAPADVPVLSKR